jgi:pilus assembly protein TadC
MVGPHHRPRGFVSAAALLLAVALLITGTPPGVRVRAGLTTVAGRPGRAGQSRVTDPLAIASGLDVLAVCLSSGMPVSHAATAAAPTAPQPLARLLTRAADLLALGVDPAKAWSGSPSQAGGAPRQRLDHHFEALLRLARRSASSGAALAHGVAELAAESRHEAADAASAAAQRASVLIAGPLGLCYLPAFLCLGIVPVVAGLADDVLQSGML